jgi:dTDP-4-amino-4,6-dideoxygalactose transaminase
MEHILAFAKQHGIYVIEDTAQAIGASYTFKDGTQKHAGTMGDIGCTSFFPSKNLGCYGDGGAIFTNDEGLANKIRMIANHGQVKKYIHKYIGVNSRLDTLQAAVLDVKLKYLDQFNAARQAAASRYDSLLANLDQLKIPVRAANSTHVFHQYTLIVTGDRRNGLKKYLEENGIPSMIYYPIPLNQQEAYKEIGRTTGDLEITNILCHSALSIPIHTELTAEEQIFIADKISSFLNA